MSFPQSEVYGWTSNVLAALRLSLDEHNFMEILPAILSERYEPGARHSVAVLGDRALPAIVADDSRVDRDSVQVTGSQYYYLPVSHCVEKQLALEHADRVYCMAPCLRLLMDGENQTGRHLYTFFQAEIEWRTDSVEEVYDVIEQLLSRFAELLVQRLRPQSAISEETVHRINSLKKTPYPKIQFLNAKEEVRNLRGTANPHASEDLSHVEEQALSERADGPFWLTEYPDGVRDSLYRRLPNGTFATYDLVLPQGYGELATGGLRPDSAEDILRQAYRLSQNPHTYYANWKRRTELQTGGLGFGVERLIRYCSGANSVLDLRFAHDQGPNARIPEAVQAWT